MVYNWLYLARDVAKKVNNMFVIFRADLYTHKKTFLSTKCFGKWRCEDAFTPKFCPVYNAIQSFKGTGSLDVYKTATTGTRWVICTLPVKPYDPNTGGYPEKAESKKFQKTMAYLCENCKYRQKQIVR